jgi:hypothetical protein
MTNLTSGQWNRLIGFARKYRLFLHDKSLFLQMARLTVNKRSHLGFTVESGNIRALTELGEFSEFAEVGPPPVR